jgi:hypothetical protein
MTVTAPIFVKFKLGRQLFVKKSYTEFHENPTNHLVTGTTSDTNTRTDGHGIHIRRGLLLKERLITNQIA